jgi:outer membrane protein
MSMKFLGSLAILVVLGDAWPVKAAAQAHGRFFIRGGPAYANFDASAHVSVAGTAVGGADVSVHSNTGGQVEAGYALTPNWEITLTLGIPLKGRIFGAGTLNAAGKLGEATYGPGVLSVLYVPFTANNFRPYIGGGLNYTLILSTHDAALTDLKIDSAAGVALQCGSEITVSGRSAWFFDIKRIWLKTNADGIIITPMGSQPASARVTLDPLILTTGLSLHL